SVGMVPAIRCHRQNMKTSIINGSEVSRLSVAIHFKLAYVYDDSNNDNDVNGDSIDNGTEGSAVRVGLGTQFSFTKNFSAYTDANYLGGGDVDQDWSANVGVKYTW
ncbi:autotransporter outer membrane beta-barrel domain-containing protein, partial [Escherichia coli]